VTNTLHRRGSKDSLRRDFVVFATVHAGKNRPEIQEKFRRFREIVARHGPVITPRPNLGAYVDINKVEPVEADPNPSATFDDYEKVKAVIRELKEADLGVSINVSGPLDDVSCACREAGFTRHSVEHSLGIVGATDRLPGGDVLEMNTLCGHGMVSHNAVKRMVDLVKAGKIGVNDAADLLARACTCGVFNTSRAREILERARTLG
jgi:hypothetical protein